MICVNKNIDNMKLSTMEKYFFHPDKRGEELLTLSWADISATIPKEGKPNFDLFEKLNKKISQLKGIVLDKQRDKTIPHLLDGNEIIKATGIPSSPTIGEIKKMLRELQLKGKIKTKEEALNYLKKNLKRKF